MLSLLSSFPALPTHRICYSSPLSFYTYTSTKSMLIIVVVSDSISLLSVWLHHADTDFSSLNSFKQSISTVDFNSCLIVEV